MPPPPAATAVPPGVRLSRRRETRAAAAAHSRSRGSTRSTWRSPRSAASRGRPWRSARRRGCRRSRARCSARIVRRAARAVSQRGQHRLEPLAGEHETGRGLADVGGARRRHRDIGGGERRRVVDPVADHQHAPSRGAHRGERPGLVGRQAMRAPDVDARRAARRLPTACRMIAGEEHHLQPELPSAPRPSRRRRGGANPRSGRESAAPSPIRSQISERPERFTSLVRAADPFAPAEPHELAAATRPPCPNRRAPRRSRATPGAMPRSAAAACEALRERMAARLRRAPRRRPRRSTSASGVSDELRLASGQRAGLVEDDRVDAGELFERRAVLQHDAAAEQQAARHDLHRRHGEPERAGAGDDQHGDAGHQRLVPAAARDEPAEEGRRRKECTAGA